MDVFGGPELQGQDLAGGVIDGAPQHGRRAAGIEPREGAASISTRAPRAASGIRRRRGARRPPGVLRGQAELLPQAADRLAGDRQAVLLGQLLGQVHIVRTFPCSNSRCAG